MSNVETFTAFAGDRRIAAGNLIDVASRVASLAHASDLILIFDDATGQQIELDLRQGPHHAMTDFHARRSPTEPAPRQGRGRPKLGVVAREVTLLPRHWDWLSAQPGGASATLRRLVEDVRRSSSGADRARQAKEALYRVMSVVAGNLPGYEEATRALFAGDDARFDVFIAGWPRDVSDYLRQLAEAEREARATA
jgi:uncharacterized protein